MSTDDNFSAVLFEKMRQICPAVNDLESYEFRYGLHNLLPESGWESVMPEARQMIEARVQSRLFYDSIQIKPRIGERIVLDNRIVELSRMLFVGMVRGDY